MTKEERQMDYKEKLEEAKRLYESANDVQKHIIENLFPELKENEDEKMKESCKFFLNLQKINSPHSISDIDKCIAWLEKQGEQKSANIIPIPDGCHAYIKDRKVYIENYTKTTSTNKVKSKFKVGDWVVDERCGLVTQVEFLEEDGYEFPNGGWVSYENADKYFHLWSIQDAKDGDVLATDKSVFIYAKVLYGKPYAYCGVDKFGVFKDNCLENNWSNSVDNIHPATKEQRDLLFKKMKESGYEFDFETKELKKIDTYCQENCKGFQETGKCFCDGECKAKKEYTEQNLQENNFPQIEQKTAWSKNDDYNVQCLTAKVTYDIQKGNIGRNQELIEWLKSLKDRIQHQIQSPQDWSNPLIDWSNPLNTK